jgi:hypothetical protein
MIHRTTDPADVENFRLCVLRVTPRTGNAPPVRSTIRWLKEGWPVALAYVAGFFLMLVLLGWNPESLS